MMRYSGEKKLNSFHGAYGVLNIEKKKRKSKYRKRKEVKIKIIK